jgi:dCMP deaminase
MKNNSSQSKETIRYPYLPEGREIKYVPADDKYMLAAKEIAEKSTCVKQKTGAVIVKNGEIIASGSNTGVKEVTVCPREKNGYETGTGYELCETTCGQEGHSEAVAVMNGIGEKIDLMDADLYLYGHWWCCQPCWEAMIAAGIKNVYLSEDSKPKS